MRTTVDLSALGLGARALSAVSADLSDARQRLASAQAVLGGDLGRAAAYAAADTWRASDRALTALATGVGEVAEALRELAAAYARVERDAITVARPR